MEIAIKYFVMTELFVCNFVCRCFFWEESNLEPWPLRSLFCAFGKTNWDVDVSWLPYGKEKKYKTGNLRRTVVALKLYLCLLVLSRE